MRKADLEMEDNLRKEYDLNSLRVRRMGSERKSFGNSTVCLEPDVAEVFSSAEAVNEALRFLIKVTKNNQPLDFMPEPTLCWSGWTILSSHLRIFFCRCSTLTLGGLTVFAESHQRRTQLPYVHEAGAVIRKDRTF